MDNTQSHLIQSVQNETQTNQSNLQPEIKKSSGGKLKWILLVIILLLISSLGAYYLGTRQNILLSQNQQKQTTPTSVQSISTPTPDPTVDWQTYANEKYGFEIKYPSDWHNIECDENEPKYVGFGPATSKLPICHSEGISSINIRIISEEEINGEPGVGYSGRTLDDQIKSFKSTLDDVIQTDITLDNISAIKIVGIISDREERQMSPIGSEQTEIAFVYNGSIYSIYNLGLLNTDPNKEKMETILDQMLSTFKFID